LERQEILNLGFDLCWLFFFSTNFGNFRLKMVTICGIALNLNLHLLSSSSLELLISGNLKTVSVLNIVLLISLDACMMNRLP